MKKSEQNRSSSYDMTGTCRYAKKPRNSVSGPMTKKKLHVALRLLSKERFEYRSRSRSRTRGGDCNPGNGGADEEDRCAVLEKYKELETHWNLIKTTLNNQSRATTPSSHCAMTRRKEPSNPFDSARSFCSTRGRHVLNIGLEELKGESLSRTLSNCYSTVHAQRKKSFFLGRETPTGNTSVCRFFSNHQLVQQQQQYAFSQYKDRTFAARYSDMEVRRGSESLFKFAQRLKQDLELDRGRTPDRDSIPTEFSPSASPEKLAHTPAIGSKTRYFGASALLQSLSPGINRISAKEKENADAKRTRQVQIQTATKDANKRPKTPNKPRRPLKIAVDCRTKRQPVPLQTCRSARRKIPAVACPSTKTPVSKPWSSNQKRADNLIATRMKRRLWVGSTQLSRTAKYSNNSTIKAPTAAKRSGLHYPKPTPIPAPNRELRTKAQNCIAVTAKISANPRREDVTSRQTKRERPSVPTRGLRAGGERHKSAARV